MAATSAALPELAQAMHMQCQKQPIVTLLSRIVHCRSFLNFSATASAPARTITSGKILVPMQGKGAAGSN